MYLLAFVLELRVECSLAAHWGQNSMVCRLRRLAEPTSRWFQMFSHRGPVPPNHGCLLCNLPIAAEVHPHNHANYSVRMRMDRTHTYIIYYSIYNIIYMCVLFTYHISCTSCFICISTASNVCNQSWFSTNADRVFIQPAQGCIQFGGLRGHL